jgi:serine-type D-Ala-D-Ala carboxypeptidase (penicillin-binding protein 5/6)
MQNHPEMFSIPSLTRVIRYNNPFAMKLSFLAILLFVPIVVFAQQSPPALSLAANSYVLFDFGSAQIIASRKANERIEPASLTKLMTAYLTFAAIKSKKIVLEQSLPVSEYAWRAEGSRMFLDPQKRISVNDLLKGMIVQSGNDASIALAEGIAGSEPAFAELMNVEAERLGMKNTHFINATGLPHAKHYSTAYDLSLLASAIIQDFPEFYPYYSIREFKYNNISQPNRNRLLWTDQYVDGMKTGFTENAGYCLIASATRGSRRLIAVVLGALSDTGRMTESQKLLNYGFQHFDSVRLYGKGESIARLPVWKGSSDILSAGFAYDFYVTIPKGKTADLKVSLQSEQPLLAPISQGQKIAVMKLSLDNKTIGEYPVVALEAVQIANIFGRAWDSMRLLFK